MLPHLICFDMDRVLVDHFSTWQFVYDKLQINNDESLNLYNQGKLDEWEWLKLDLALIKGACEAFTDQTLRKLAHGTPLMENLHDCIETLLNEGHHIAIISGGMQETAREIASKYLTTENWRRRWGGIDNRSNYDTKLHVFTNGWVSEFGQVQMFGRYQVQMNGKGSVVNILQRRLSIPKSRTISIGDSAGDIDMFHQSGFAICFNPYDDRPLQHVDEVIRIKDLHLVLDSIQKWIKSRRDSP